MELVNVEVKQQLGTIESNLDAVEASIKEQLSVYKTMVVTEDTIADSKKVVAELRKGKKELDDSRKSIKNDWNKPYTAFEKRAKEVIALYDEPINLINNQLVQFEEDRKVAKRVEIKAAYEELKGDLEDYLSYEAIYNSKWENISVSMKSVKDDMQLRFDQVAIEIGTIKALDSEFEEQGMEMYKLTGDLQKAIEDMAKRKKMKEEIIAQEKAKAEAYAEEQARKAEEAKRIEEESKKLKEEAEQTIEDFDLPEDDEPLDEEEPFNIEEAFDTMDCEESFVVKEEVKYVQVILTAPVKDWSYLLQVADKNGWKWEAYDGE